MTMVVQTSALPCRGWRFGLFCFISRFIAASLLIIAGILKCYELFGAAESMPALTVAARVILPVVEIALALCLMGTFDASVTQIAAALFFGFAVYNVYRARVGYASCGCFGSVMHVPPLYTAVVDVSVALSLSFVAMSAAKVKRTRRQKVALMKIATTVFAITVLTVLIPMTDQQYYRVGNAAVAKTSFVALDPAQWVGRPLPIADDIVADERFTVGRWHILLIDPGCGACQQKLERCVEMMVKGGSTDSKTLCLSINGLDGIQNQNELRRSGLRLATLTASVVWEARVPQELDLVDGTVVAVY